MKKTNGMTEALAGQESAILGVSVALNGAQGIPDERLSKYLFDVQRQAQYKPDDKTLVISGLDITLDDCFSKNIKDLRIYAHIVRINGTLCTSGTANISIFCRYAVFGPGASIDVSGLVGEKRIGQAKPGNDGQKPGDPGEQGDQGAKGDPGTGGGRINILAEQILGAPVLKANGGPGGRGQDGGKGGVGKAGVNGLNQEARSIPKPGSKFRVSIIITQHATAGGPGGKGGKGGTGGQRGDHGNGGMIFVRTVSPATFSLLQAEPGQEFVIDQEADGGPGGVGGSGGKGGFMLYDPAKPGRQIQEYCPNGADSTEVEKGDSPLAAEHVEPGPVDEKKTALGNPGTVDVKTAAPAEIWQRLWEQETFLSCFSSDNTLLSMALFAAERLYLNTEDSGDTQAVAEVLGYLHRATAGSVKPRMHAIHGRCEGLLLNLERGLDYYGKLPNFIPSLSFSEIKEDYDQYVKIALDMQSDTDAFWAEEEAKRKTKTFLKKQTANMGDLIEKQLKPKREDLDKTIRSLHDSIASLSLNLEKQEQVIRAAADDFHQALLRKLQCEQLIDIFTVAKSIIQAGVNVAPAFSGMKAISEFSFDGSKSFSERIKPLGTIVDSIVKVQGNVQEISKAFSALNSLKAKENNDSVKLVVKKEEFDGMMKQFADIPEAKPYVDAMHDYMEIANQRNTAIANHDAACIEGDNLLKKIKLIERETADIETEIAENTNSLRPALLQYIEQSLQTVKSLVIETLHSMARSLEYYTLSPKRLRLVDYRVSTLEGHYAYLLSELKRAKEKAGPRTHFPARKHVIVDSSQIELLKQGKPVWVTLPLNTNSPPKQPFANIECPLISEVRCFLDGVSSANPEATATVTLQHSGVSHLFNEQNDSVWTFAHAQRTISFEYRIKDNTYREDQGDLTDRNQFMMLSPFAIWGVQVRPEDGNNGELDLSTLKKATLSLIGYGVIRPPGESKSGK